MAERADDAAHSVAERHDQKVSERAQAPRAAHREIVHIRHAVFKAAEDEYAHAEKERKVFAQLVRIGAVAVHGEVDHHIAENGEQKRAEERLGKLDGAEGLRARTEGGEARELLCGGDERRAGKITEPDDRQRARIGAVVFFAGTQPFLTAFIPHYFRNRFFNTLFRPTP